MVSMLERSVISHFRRCKRQAGVTAEYRSNGVTQIQKLTVVPASRLASVANSEGDITLTLDDDILILVSDMGDYRPEHGDEILIKDDRGKIQQTNTIDRSPPFDFEDSYRKIYRIHTKVTDGAVSIPTVFAINGKVFAVNGEVFAVDKA